MAEIYWIQIWKGLKMQAKFQMIVLKINLPKNSLQFFNELENKRPIGRFFLTPALQPSVSCSLPEK